jgi:hypothetical protein
MPSVCYKSGLESWSYQTIGGAHGCTKNTLVFQRLTVPLLSYQVHARKT